MDRTAWQWRWKGEAEVSRRSAVLVALGSLLLLTWLTVTLRAPVIESDLAERVHRSLVTHGISELAILVDGRDVVIGGEIAGDLDPDRIGRIAGETWGVRTVNIDGLQRQASPLDPQDPLNARFETQRIMRLGGDLSNPLDAPACQGMLARIASDGTLRFEVDGASPLPESYPLLNDLAAVAYQCPGTRLVIGGHTDAGEDREFQLRLSAARARAVERFFQLAGIPGERLQSVAFGDSQPVASNSSAAGRAANRRITFDVLPLE